MATTHQDVVKEALAFVHANQGLVAANHSYQSPRVSSEIPDCSLPMTFDDKEQCFVAGTLISTLRGCVPIESIVVGDTVISHNTDGNYNEQRVVTRCHNRTARELVYIRLENDVELTVTRKHPFYVLGNRDERDIWVEAKDLKVGDELFTDANKSTFIQEIVPYEEKTIVYNISVDEFENYFANGILVHNCSLGCTYCFAFNIKSNNPCKTDYSLNTINVDRMIKAMQGEFHGSHGEQFYNHFYSKKFVLHWGGLADGFCNFEKENGTAYKLARFLGDFNYPTLFSTKGADVLLSPKYQRLFRRYSGQQNFAFQVSIITNSDALSRNVEIGVPSTSKRIELLKSLSEMGYYTIIRLRPFIIGVSDIGLDELLGRSLEAGIRGISTEFFAMDCRCTEGMQTRYDWLAKQMGLPKGTSLHDYYKAISPSERGGYMRLNRDLKEPYIRKIFDFCKKNNLVLGVSDPDFKELCTTGSCCALPNSFPANKGLQNWTKDQLTYHITQARKLFHREGGIYKFVFDEVYNGKTSTYLDELKLSNDHISVIGRSQGERGALTQKLILQEQWNNLNSPANPMNYFHGKLMPTGLDARGNLIFRYNPMPYEDRWKNEGIDLTY